MDNLNNYRPVANVPFLSKLVEVLEEADALDPFQSEFRSHHNMETSLLALHDDLLRKTDRGKIYLLVLLDISVAFDTVNHGVLLGRFSGLGISSLALSWLRSFLKD